MKPENTASEEHPAQFPQVESLTHDARNFAGCCLVGTQTKHSDDALALPDQSHIE